jgi:hypothetical protein
LTTTDNATSGRPRCTEQRHKFDQIVRNLPDTSVVLTEPNHDNMTSADSRLSTFRIKYRSFRYSLRTLFVITLLAAIACGLLRSAWDRARNEKYAVEELRKLGASTDDWPGWQEVLFGHDYPPVVEVELRNVKQLDGAFEYLRDLTNLEHLDLGGTKTTDHHLKSLRDLAVIESLDLKGTLIRDTGLEHISRLSRLRHLSLEDTKVTDGGVKKLRQALPNCIIHR